MASRAPIVALLAVTTLVLAACRSGGRATPARSVVSVHTATPVSDQPLTGLSALDQALRAALAEDTIEMARLTGYQKVACSTTGDPGRPACRDSEEPGTAAEVFLTLGCSEGWVRPEYVPAAYAAVLKDKHPRLIAVYEPSVGIQFVRLGTEYIAVIATDPRVDAKDSAVALYVKGGRFVALEDNCGQLPGLLDAVRIKAWVLRPGGTPSGAAPPASTNTP